MGRGWLDPDGSCRWGKQALVSVAPSDPISDLKFALDHLEDFAFARRPTDPLGIDMDEIALFGHGISFRAGIWGDPRMTHPKRSLDPTLVYLPAEVAPVLISAERLRHRRVHLVMALRSKISVHAGRRLARPYDTREPQHRGQMEDAARAAFVELEDRMRALVRQLTGKDIHEIPDIVNFLFGDSGPLTETMTAKQREPPRMLILGAFGVFRNLVGHRTDVFPNEGYGIDVILVADLAMRLLDEIEASLRPQATPKKRRALPKRVR